MDKREFYKEQAEKFRDFFKKFPNGDLLPLFEQWCESKDIYGKDKNEIWRIARKLKIPQAIEISETSDDFVRVDAVLKLLFDADMKGLERLMEKKEKRDRQDNNLDKT